MPPACAPACCGSPLDMRLAASQVKAEAEAASRAAADASRAAAALAPAPAPAVPLVPAAPAGGEGEGGLLPALNALGVVAAGGLGGAWYLSRKDSAAEAARYEEKIAGEVAAIGALRSEVAAAGEAAAAKDALIEKIRRESRAVETSMARQMELEREVGGLPTDLHRPGACMEAVPRQRRCGSTAVRMARVKAASHS